MEVADERSADGELVAQALSVLVEEAWKDKASGPLAAALDEVTSSQLLQALRGPRRRSLLGFLRRLMHRAAAVLLCRPREGELEKDAFSLLAWGSKDLHQVFISHLRDLDAEGRLLVLASKIACVSGSCRARLDSWKPPAGRTAGALRLVTAWSFTTDTVTARREHIAQNWEVYVHAILFSIMNSAPLPASPPLLPLVGEEDEWDELDALFHLECSAYFSTTAPPGA